MLHFILTRFTFQKVKLKKQLFTFFVVFLNLQRVILNLKKKKKKEIQPIFQFLDISGDPYWVEKYCIKFKMEDIFQDCRVFIKYSLFQTFKW